MGVVKSAVPVYKQQLLHDVHARQVCIGQQVSFACYSTAHSSISCCKHKTPRNVQSPTILV